MNSRDIQKYDFSEKVNYNRFVSFKKVEAIITWGGYKWKSSMDGGRLIHPGFPYQWYSEEQVKIINNQLELWIKRQSKEIHHWDGNVYNPAWAVGTLRSIETFYFGTFEADIMVPQGYNLWPSFWLTGDGNWPPEIDIMEGWSGENDYYKWFIAQPPYLSPSWRTTTNVHFNNNLLEHESIGTRNICWFKQKNNPSHVFVNYKVIWKPDSIKFLINNKIVREVKQKYCNYLIKNLKNKEKGYGMNVIFNVWCENPSLVRVEMVTPMIVKNFKYTPLEEMIA